MIHKIKVPYKVKDRFGNEATLYRFRRVSKEMLEAQKAKIEEQIKEVEKLEAEEVLEEIKDE